MTWVFVPSSFSQASACWAKDCEPGSPTWVSRIAPCVSLSGKLTQPPSWRRAWKKDRWLALLCGPTFPPSTLEHGVAAWIASLPASPAKTSALQAAVLGSTASDPACSSRLSASPPIAVRGSCSWRTSLASLLPPPPLWTRKKASSKNAQPPESWENWPTSGGMRSGSLWERPKWEPATGAHDGSASPGAWATPDCNTSSYSNGLFGQNIREQASAWMTPTAQDIEQAGGAGSISRKKRGHTLNSQAAHSWTTPKASDGEKGGPNMRGSKGDLPLPAQSAQWPTPMTRDHHAQGSGNQQKSPSLGTTTGQWPTPVSSDHKSQLGGGMPDRMNNRTASPSLSQVVTHSHCSPQALPIPDGQPSSLSGRTLRQRLVVTLMQRLESGSWDGHTAGPTHRRQSLGSE